MGNILRHVSVFFGIFLVSSFSDFAIAQNNKTFVPRSSGFPNIAEDPFDCAIHHASNIGIDECNRENLFNIANQNLHTDSYKKARTNMFQVVDVFTDYNGDRVVESIYTPDTYLVGDSGIPQNGVNTEHSWPQSLLKQYDRFNQSKCDLYHLFPVNGRDNSRRNNHFFANCNGEAKGTLDTGILCKAGYEPPTKQKGTTARAMFYMAVTYSLTMDDAQEAVLREWNMQYPIESREITRGESISQIQGNINPFIEHPEWVSIVSDY